MISDEKTNFLYLADTLPKLFPEFWKQFELALKEQKINFDFLPGTNDVWCRDYMPVQTNAKRFVQFVYQPGYLQTIEYKPTISNPDEICRKVGIKTIHSEIKLDGGNVIKSEKQAIVTDKIFSENPQIERKQLIVQIQELLEVERLHVIPKQPFDFTGHADGMVRFLDEETLLLNDFGFEKDWFQKRLKGKLNQTGLKIEKFVYSPMLSLSKEDKDTAEGTYINFLQIGKVIFLPVFNKTEDEIALKQTQNYFPGCTVIPVFSNELAKKGGVLNCISWNIVK